MKAKDITKGSTLLATIRSEFNKGEAKDLENELHAMIDKALSLPVVVGQSEQLLAFANHIYNDMLRSDRISTPEEVVQDFLSK